MREVLEIIVGIWFFVGMCMGLSTMNFHKDTPKWWWVLNCIICCPIILIFYKDFEKSHIIRETPIVKKYNEFWNNPQYDFCYIAVDIHGTIFEPSFENEETYKYYPYAKECLQILSNNPKIKLILWSGCYANVFQNYINHFENNNIHFDYINENPECKNSSYACLDKKFYFDIGIDDRFGFDATTDWEELYNNINKK